jgi:hypothetical protein
MKGSSGNVKLLAWKLGNRLLRTPAAPLLRGLFGRRSGQSAWRGFVPTAVDAEPLTVRVDPDNVEASAAEIALLLRKHGVVRLPALVDSAEAAAAGQALAAFLEPFAERQEHEPHGEVLGCDWQTGTDRIPDYLTRPAPVVSFLGDGPEGVDAGFIVLSRVEAIAARQGFHRLDALLGSPPFRLVERIVAEAFSVGLKIRQFLLSRSAATPRSLHTDTLGEFYNMFTYLSDVRSVGDGPFTYVPGSHLRRDLLTKGAFLLGLRGRHPKEYPEMRDRAVPMLGPAGTVIIANQRGVHGAHPQGKDGCRAMLIVNFLPGPRAVP